MNEEEKLAPVSVRPIVWNDIMWACLFGGKFGDVESTHYWMNWRLYEVHSVDVETGVPSYLTEGGEETEDVEKAEPLFFGYIKWDGCMQWGVGGETYQFHVDGRSEIRAMCEALERVRDEMRKMGHEEYVENR